MASLVKIEHSFRFKSSHRFQPSLRFQFRVKFTESRGVSLGVKSMCQVEGFKSSLRCQVVTINTSQHDLTMLEVKWGRLLNEVEKEMSLCESMPLAHHHQSSLWGVGGNERGYLALSTNLAFLNMYIAIVGRC